MQAFIYRNLVFSKSSVISLGFVDCGPTEENEDLIREWGWFDPTMVGQEEGRQCIRHFGCCN